MRSPIQTTRSVIISTMGNSAGKYLKLNGVSSLFTYKKETSAKDLTWSPIWVEDPADATDFGNQAEDVLLWVHAFTSSVVDRRVIVTDDWMWEIDHDTLTAMTLKDIRTIAKARRIRGRSKMSKVALIKALSC